MRKTTKKYWYKITYTECVMGDVYKVIRERIYGRKPKDPRNRIFYEQFLCQNHY